MLIICGSPVCRGQWFHHRRSRTQAHRASYLVAFQRVDRVVDHALTSLAGTAVAVCSAEDDEAKKLADVVLPVVGCVPEELSPLVYLAAAELFAMHFAVAHDKVMLGFDDEFRKEVNFRQIFDSPIPDCFDN